MAAPVFALIGCSKAKRAEAAPARQLYDASDLFKKARGYAEARRLSWFVLSAKYGLVAPGVWTFPYDLTLSELTRSEREAWAAKVTTQLAARGLYGRPCLMLAGRLYRDALQLPACEVPLAGLGIGQQKARLLELTRDALADA